MRVPTNPHLARSGGLRILRALHFPTHVPTRRVHGLRRALRLALGAGLALLLAGVAGCSREPASAQAQGTGAATNAPATPSALRVVAAESRRLERTIPVTGSLLPLDQTPVSVQVAGRLQSIAVDLGSLVHEGDLLARVDGADYELKVKQSEAALGQARARVGLPLEGDDDRVDAENSSSVKEARAVLEEAKANRDRIQALSRQGILSTSELETAAATYKVSLSRYEEALEEARIRMASLQQRRAEFEIARKQLADTYLLAPFDGAVQERRANVGEYLAVGTPVVVLVRTDPLRLRVEVSERDASRVRTGQVVRVTVEGHTHEASGIVKRLSPAIVQGSRTLVVEADVPAQNRLRAGAFARARIVIEGEDTAVTVPPEAVVTFAGLDKVFTVIEGKAVEKRITVGDRGAGWVEVVAGVQAGDRVVLNPGGLQTGQPVSEAPPSATKPAGRS